MPTRVKKQLEFIKSTIYMCPLLELIIFIFWDNVCPAVVSMQAELVTEINLQRMIKNVKHFLCKIGICRAAVSSLSREVFFWCRLHCLEISTLRVAAQSGVFKCVRS